MPAQLTLRLAWSLRIAHGQLQLRNVTPNISSLPVREPEFAIASRVQILRISSLHERLILKKTDGILDDPKVGVHVPYDAESSFDVATPRLCPRELSTGAAGVHRHDVGRPAVLEKIVNWAFEPPGADVGNHRGLEFGVDVDR